MNGLETILSMVEYTLQSRRNRHMTGGILMSIAMLFSGLSITVITLKTEEKI